MKPIFLFIKCMSISLLLIYGLGWGVKVEAQVNGNLPQQNRTNFPYSLTTTYKTIGNATTIDANTNEFQLTPDDYGQVGGVWAQTPLDLQKCFTIKAQLNFGSNDYGADGIVFILSKKKNVLGPAGGDLGYTGITPSCAVEFDTWQNYEFNDPPDDHLAFLKKGSVIHTNPKYVYPLSNIETGEYYDVTFTWDVNTKVFTVNFLGNDYPCPLDSVITNVGDLPQVYFGFTAATGAARNLQLVKIISVENECLTKGLIAYYPFNGNANDSSSNNNNGIAKGAILTSDSCGYPNTAYEFDGKNSYILIPTSNSLESPSLTNQITQAAWFKYLGPSFIGSQSNPIIAKTNSADNVFMYRMYILTTGIGVDFNNYSLSTVYFCPYHFDTGRWYFLATTFNGSACKFYVNDSLIMIIKRSTIILPSNLPLTIGKDAQGEPEIFYGSIGDVWLYNRALSDHEISSLYNYSCSNSAFVLTKQNTVSNHTSQIKVNDNELAAYIAPNPSQSEFKMELKGIANTPISVQLIDANGRLIKTYNKLASNQILIFGRELQKGIYFAEVSQNNQKKVLKLVKL